MRRLDLLVVTHAQADHEGGAAAVLDAFPVGLVLDGRDGVRTPDGDRLAAAAALGASGCSLPRRASASGRVDRRSTSVAALRAGRLHRGADPNQRAIVAEVHDRGASVLLTADAESDVLARSPLAPVDVLKVAHHGSADPGLPALLRRLRPRVALIEVGRHNPYGHPAPATLARAAQASRRPAHRPRRHRPAAPRTGGRASPSSATPRVSARWPTFKPAYLIHGDDHGRIAERRARLRAMAEAESGASGLEVFEGDAATPEAIAGALAAMTFAIGRRFVDRRRRRALEGRRGRGRARRAGARGHRAGHDGRVLRARGRARRRRPRSSSRRSRRRAATSPSRRRTKARDLPRWLVGRGQAARRRARRRGGAGARRPRRRAPAAAAARAREARDRAWAGRAHRRRGGRDAAADSAERQVWGLVDALVARDGAAAARAFLELRDQGEAMPRLIPLMARRVREVLAIAARLEDGESPAQIKASIPGNPWAVDQRIKRGARDRRR